MTPTMLRLPLSGSWELRAEPDGPPLAATIPGDTYSANLAAGRIPDPYYGTNENDVQWVCERTWVYRRTFAATPELLAAPSVFLHLQSVDTFAEVRLNGSLVGETDNMFRRYRFEVKPQLRAGQNELSVRLLPPAPVARARAARLPFPVPGTGNNRVPHMNLLRKVQCHAGWDWGICLPPAGIYDDVWLGAVRDGRIEYVYCEQAHTAGSCRVTVTAEVTALRALASEMVVTLDGQTVRRPVQLAAGANRVSAVVEVKAPRLWWPAGYGAQPLYDLQVSVAGDECTKRLGLRHLEVLNAPDAAGRQLVVRVNGRDIFCKGANWIPCDAMPGRHTPAAYRDLLQSAIAANMNMLRVWGGGQYENACFYELCDELGLLLWHDFMFACALYPATPDFLASVREEVRHQVKRLRDYACIALWCGDNEVIGALGWYKESREKRDTYVVNYDRLNHGVLEATVAECDPTRIFWPSSPCAGPGNFADNWHNDAAGDMHFWSVWHGGKPFDEYCRVKPRFCSEFGYQSFPSLASIHRYLPERDWNITAPAMEHHQRHPSGNRLIVEMMARYFRVPQGLGHFVYLSQVQQACAIRTAVEYWRTLRPRCMGTLYWQLNDNWPVASWSSLEYGGRWKLLHYVARRFYAPVLATARSLDDGPWECWLVNDGAAIPGCRYVIEVRELASGKVLKSETVALDLPAEAAVQVASRKLDELTDRPEATFLELRVDGPGGVLARNTHFFAPYKRCYLPDAKVLAAPRVAGDTLTVTLSTDAPAFFVSVDAPNLAGSFEDNCLTLLPGAPVALRFTPAPGSATPASTLALTLNHLRATY